MGSAGSESGSYQLKGMASTCIPASSHQMVVKLKDAAGALGSDNVGTAFQYGLGTGLSQPVCDIVVLEAGYAASAAACTCIG